MGIGPSARFSSGAIFTLLVFGLSLGLSLSLLGSQSSRAEEEDAPVKPAPRKVKTRTSKSKKVRPPREKETEGTEAPDRFQADTVIKSEYEVDGKKLEVDPD